jgi:medium-chain acyl-[acyl-carrier-protein] hydrolase
MRRSVALLKESTSKRIRVLGFPYAGGSSTCYASWSEHLPDEVELCSLILPGRESRRAEPVPSHAAELLGDLLDDYTTLDPAPLILFGHSMGAILAHDFAHLLLQTGHRGPLALFVAASEPPHRNGAASLAALDDDGLVRIADERWDGFPDALRDPGPLRASVLALVRADLALLASCAPGYGEPLACPIYLFGGRADRHLTRDDLTAWSVHGRVGSVLRMFEGGHLFLLSAPAEVSRAVVSEIPRLLCSEPDAAAPGQVDASLGH